MARATSSLPDPEGPVIKTRLFVGATRSIDCLKLSIAGELPIRSVESVDFFFSSLISLRMELASNARKTFENSSFEQKRELLSLVFQNLQLEEKKLVFSMNKPFDLIAECAKTGEWCTLVDVIRTCGNTRNIIINTSNHGWERLQAV